MTACPQVLVVAEPGDGGARAAWRLASAGSPAGSTALVSGEELATARWSHRVGADGRTRTTITTRRGRPVADDRVRLVWFRARTWRQWGVATQDADYARAELTALVVSWLGSLGDRLVNPVDGMSAVGPSWSPPRWLAAATAAGLPVAPWTAATSARTVPGWRGSPWDARRPYDDRFGMHATPIEAAAPAVLVVGDEVVGASDSTLAAGCRRLAAASGCRLLRIWVDAEGRVRGVEPCPPLASDAEVTTVAGLLRSGLAGAAVAA